MSEVPPHVAEMARSMAHFVPHAKALGFETLAVARGHGTMKAPWMTQTLGDPDRGIVAGGLVTTLIDHVCGLAVQSARDEVSPIATLDLRIDYLRPARGERDIIAHAHCYRLTRSVAFVRAEAHDGDPDDLVATAQAAFILNTPGLAISAR
jgi:uncharacterized protein (TIGR00369 family)